MGYPQFLFSLLQGVKAPAHVVDRGAQVARGVEAVSIGVVWCRLAVVSSTVTRR
jgi:hypothetical protein